MSDKASYWLVPMRFAVCALVFALCGCAGTALEGAENIPSEIAAVPTTFDYTKLTCLELEQKSAQITQEYRDLRFNHRNGIRDHFGKMNGHALAINDAIRINSCKIPSVRIPGNPLRESRNEKLPASR
jgi:hypothetical protein